MRGLLQLLLPAASALLARQPLAASTQHPDSQALSMQRSMMIISTLRLMRLKAQWSFVTVGWPATSWRPKQRRTWAGVFLLLATLHDLSDLTVVGGLLNSILFAPCPAPKVLTPRCSLQGHQNYITCCVDPCDAPSGSISSGPRCVKLTDCRSGNTLSSVSERGAGAAQGVLQMPKGQRWWAVRFL